MGRYRQCICCSQKYNDIAPEQKSLMTEGCDADLRMDSKHRPYICTGYYGAYDYGTPIYFKGIQTLEKLQTKYSHMVIGCDICDDCLHQFVNQDELEILWSDGKLVSLKTILEKES